MIKRLLRILAFTAAIPLVVYGCIYLVPFAVNTFLPETTEPPVISQPLPPAPVVQKEVPTPQGDKLTVEQFVGKVIPPTAKPVYPIITLSKKNTLTFRAVVNTTSIATLVRQATKLSKNLNPKDTIYLFLDSPGGSVDDGLLAIDALNALPQEVKTISSFSASMAFHMLESLGERLVLPSATLMSHRISVGGISGTVPGTAVTRLNDVITLSNQLDEKIAKRIGMNVKDYQRLIEDEWWGHGEDNIKYNMADRVVLARCADDLLEGTHWQTIETLFGAVKLEWEDCPLVAYPVSIKYSSLVTETDKLDEYLRMFFYDKEKFVKTYIIGNK